MILKELESFKLYNQWVSKLAKVNRRKKDAYWHNVARVCLEYGFKPAQTGKVIKSIFPETEITGRHIGAYNRRLKTENYIMRTDILPKPVMSLNAMMDMAKGLVTDEDKFIYDCSIGSVKQSLKCFEYKMTEEIKDEMEGIDVWLESIAYQE